MQVEAVGAKRHAGQHAATGLQGVLQLGIIPCSAGGAGFKEESASRGVHGAGELGSSRKSLL